eukprot:755278-Hanusia_phi.AAC.1
MHEERAGQRMGVGRGRRLCERIASNVLNPAAIAALRLNKHENEIDSNRIRVGSNQNQLRSQSFRGRWGPICSLRPRCVASPPPGLPETARPRIRSDDRRLARAARPGDSVTGGTTASR